MAIEHSDWRDGFLFVGNHLALDFLNTRPVQNGEATELLPDFSALLRWFQAAGQLEPRAAAGLLERWKESTQTRRTLEAMRSLRERLRKEIVAWEHGRRIRQSTVEELNRLMAEHPMRARLRGSEKKLAIEAYLAPQQPEDLFAPLAYSASILFSEIDRARVRKCDNCVLHFCDTSKKGTRRWCSMRLCGNRLKVAAYAARQHSP